MRACILNYLLLFIAQLCPTLCNPMDNRTPGFLVLYFPWSLLKLMSIELIKSSNHLIPCCRLLLLPSIFPSIKVFSDESALPIKWANWELQFSFNLPSENSGLISFGIDWFDLQCPRNSQHLLQHCSLKASVLWHSVFFMVQLSHLYITTVKNHSFDQINLCQQSDVFAF